MPKVSEDFEKAGLGRIKLERQQAADSLLEKLDLSKAIKTLNDKVLAKRTC